MDIERIRTEITNIKLAAVQGTGIGSTPRTIIMADSRYEAQRFLGMLEYFQHTFDLIRLRGV